MSNERVIQATFASYRPVLGRKVLQLVFEVPIEAQEATFATLGYPVPDESLWVAIARLNLAAAPSEPAQIAHDNDDDEPNKPPRPLSQIAGMLCGMPTFRKFIEEGSDGWDHMPTVDEAGEWLRANCQIESRRELNTNEEAAIRFRKIRAEYNAWMIAA